MDITHLEFEDPINAPCRFRLSDKCLTYLALHGIDHKTVARRCAMFHLMFYESSRWARSLLVHEIELPEQIGSFRDGGQVFLTVRIRRNRTTSTEWTVCDPSEVELPFSDMELDWYHTQRMTSEVAIEHGMRT